MGGQSNLLIPNQYSNVRLFGLVYEDSLIGAHGRLHDNYTFLSIPDDGLTDRLQNIAPDLFWALFHYIPEAALQGWEAVLGGCQDSGFSMRI